MVKPQAVHKSVEFNCENTFIYVSHEGEEDKTNDLLLTSVLNDMLISTEADVEHGQLMILQYLLTQCTLV